MKTIQETQPGTKPRALIHLALSEPSTLALKNLTAGATAGLLAPGLSPACPQGHTFQASPVLALPLDPRSYSATSPNCNIQRSSVVEKKS